MSTPEHLLGVQAERPAERALFSALFDDAAVFPPALVTLPRAISDHVELQASSYADLVGPLLLPVTAVQDFVHLDHPPIAVVLIGQPGTDPSLVVDALSRLRATPAVNVTGVEIGWSPEWHEHEALFTRASRGAPLSVEVPSGVELRRILAELQEHADDPNPVQAKFRTGSTPDRPVPTPTELATFIRACVDHDLSFKLTGGLHHAFSTTTSSHSTTGVEDQFGFLNVIAATRWALAHAAEVPEMESLLSQRDPVPILDIITRMSEADASVLRAFFTAYGCCAVMDPIGDLAALGLITKMSA